MVRTRGNAGLVAAIAVISMQWGCGGDDPSAPPPPSPAISCVQDNVFASEAVIDSARACVGSATGTAATGRYVVVFRNPRFSTDCTPAFASRNNFYVDGDAPEDVIRTVLEKGYRDQGGVIRVAQTEGRIVVGSEADGVDEQFEIRGWLDSSGRFRALFAIYESSRAYYGALYDGTITGAEISGSFIATLTRRDGTDVPGSCSFYAEYAGTKL